MRAIRLTLALDSGALVLPDAGPILVMNAQGADDLSMLPATRLRIVQAVRPDHDALAARGYLVAPQPPDEACAGAIVFLPRARQAARAMIAAAERTAAPGATIAVDGQKTDGVEAVMRELGARVAVSPPVVKAHGKLFTFCAGANLADWRAETTQIDGGFFTRPGVFSADGPDRGSMLLAAALPMALQGRGVDLGAGWGYLAAAALTRAGVTHLDLVEADADAVACARMNVTDPRAVFHWADATLFHPAHPADWVVCNPPFHAGRDADPAIGQAFLRAAARMLAPHGTLWLVANRHLPYDRTLGALFRKVDDIGGDPAFRLTRAARPLPPLPRIP